MQVFTQFDAQLESLWDTALSQEANPWPFFTYAWHKSWYTHLGQGEKLAIMGNTDSPVLLPLRIEGNTVHFTGGEEIADYLDAIGASEDKANAWEQALPMLKQQGATQLVLRNIPHDSTTLAFFKNLGTSEISEEDTTPVLALPDTFEQYLAALGRKQRHEMRRKVKRFEEQQKDIAIQTDTLDVELLLTLMRHNEEKKAFLSPKMQAFFRKLPEVSARSLRQFTLTRGSTPVATTLAFQIDSALLLYNSGFLPAVEGAGWYLKAKIVQWCIQSRLTTINFLQGKERYKYDFGATDFPVYRVLLTL